MKVLITGGTGFVGKRLITKLFQSGHQAVVTTRDPQRAQRKIEEPVKFVAWDYHTQAFPPEALEDVEAIVNLMGENISAKRWSEEQKKKIADSRIIATQKLVKACNEFLLEPLEVFISGSAIGIYEANSGKKLDEFSPPTDGFLAHVCKEWEKEASQIEKSKRLIISRTGVVLGPESGALGKLLPLFKAGLGGPIGSGKMMMSWIHVGDMVDTLISFLENPAFSGIYNMTSPRPVTNAQFTKALGKALHRPTLFPAPPFMLKLAFGEMSSIILDSQEVIPKRLIEAGHQFGHPDIEGALNSLL